MIYKYLSIIKKATIYIIVPLGLMHIIISHIYAVITGSYEEINYFHILAIDLIFPSLKNGLRNTLLSQLIYVIPISWVTFLYIKEKNSSD